MVKWSERSFSFRRIVVSIPDTYRAMSNDVIRAATDVEDEEVRRAYLALAEIWRKRADGFPIPADEHQPS